MCLRYSAVVTSKDADRETSGIHSCIWCKSARFVHAGSDLGNKKCTSDSELKKSCKKKTVDI